MLPIDWRLASFLPWDPWAIPTAVPRPASTSAKQKAARTAPRAQIATFAAGAATEVSIRSSTCEAPGSPWSHKAPSVGGIRRTSALGMLVPVREWASAWTEDRDRTLFSSFQKHLVHLEQCPRLLVCDGFTPPEGRKQLCSEEAMMHHRACRRSE
eukprot:s278_g13.t1